jgi:hypothetical protein
MQEERDDEFSQYIKVLYRFCKERVIIESEASSLELKAINHWINNFAIVKKIRKNPDEPTEEQTYFTITSAGEEYYKRWKKEH